jgi:hypothetical protein
MEWLAAGHGRLGAFCLVPGTCSPVRHSVEPAGPAGDGGLTGIDGYLSRFYTLTRKRG